MHTRTFFRQSQDGAEKVDVSGVGGEGGGGGMMVLMATLAFIFRQSDHKLSSSH
jgi:hypothetical protein